MSNSYKDIALVEDIECENVNIIKLKVIPHENFHRDVPYYITLKFNDDNSWPLLYVDSIFFDKLKTKQYLLNKGKHGDHKGICIEHFSYHYSGYKKYFQLYCNSKWENYIYNVIHFLNNIDEQTYVGGFGTIKM